MARAGRSNSPYAPGQHGVTGRNGRAGLDELGERKTARAIACGRTRPKRDRLKLAASGNAVAASERCRGREPHERRPGNLPAKSGRAMPGPTAADGWFRSHRDSQTLA